MSKTTVRLWALGSWLLGHRGQRLPKSQELRAKSLAALAALIALSANAQQLQETITVERILIDARVTDATGEPMLHLVPADFRVKIDGKPATVESVEWIPETAAAREIADIDKPPVEPNLTMNIPPPRGRLLV
ncbi:MAG: hypothetical protein ACXVJT_11215, partial [Thermoanaerobaculia bacterium]